MAGHGSNENSPYDNFDWKAYSYRPPYPPSLTQLILDYHNQHSSSNRLLHDIGSGNGVYAATLAPHFKHVHASDPGENNIPLMQKTLGSVAKEGTFSCSLGTAEEADSVVPPEVRGDGVDLITAMECIHWCTDIDKAAQSMGKSLAPGGSLAIVYYGGRVHLPDNEEANAIATEIFHGMALSAMDSESVRRAFMQGPIGTDFVPLPADLFDREKTRRININNYGPMWYPGDSINSAKSQVAEGEKVENYKLDHPWAMDWSREVDADWFEPYMKSFGGIKTYDPVDLLEKLKRALGPGKTRVCWRVSVLLATKLSS